MSKMVIMQVVGRMNRGGVESFMMNVLRSIDRTKFHFVFLCYFEGKYDFEDEINDLGAEIVRIKDNRVRNPFKFVADIEDVIRSKEVEIVHSHVDYSTAYAMIAAKRVGIKKRIAHSHNTRASKSLNPLRLIFPVITKYLINSCATVRVACEEAAGKALFYDANDFTVLRNGIELSKYSFSPSNRSLIRKDLNIPSGSTVLLHVGRFETQKNHLGLLDIFSSYTRRNKDSMLLMLGDGSLRAEVERAARIQGLADHVVFLGSRADAEKYYSAADVFVLPSLYEGLPVSAIEAQSNGLNCLVSDTTDRAVNMGLVDFIPVANVDAWSRTIEAKSRRDKKSYNLAYAKLRREYDISSVTVQLRAIYEAR